jgi:N-acetylglutamate synthase-like GNAT family acetyltransferase
MALRRATLADAKTIRNLTRSAYGKWVPLIGREPRPMTVNYEKAVLDHIIDLYEAEGEVLALVEVVPREQHLLIENIAVLPKQQGKGIGELLLNHVENTASSLRLAELRLYTNAAFVSNLQYYKRHGFHEFAREPIKAGGELVHMKKAVGLQAPR